MSELTNRGSSLAKQFLSELKASTSSRGNTPTKASKAVKEDDGRLRQSRLGLGAKPKRVTQATKITGSVATTLGKSLTKSRKRKAYDDKNSGTPEPDYSEDDSEDEKEAASKGASKKESASADGMHLLDSLLETTASKKKRKKAKAKKSKKVADAVAAVEAKTAAEAAKAAAPPATASSKASVKSGGGGGGGADKEDVFATFSAGDFATNWGGTPSSASSSSAAAAATTSDSGEKKKKKKSKKGKATSEAEGADAKKVVDDESFGKWGDAVKGLSSVDFASKWGTTSDAAASTADATAALSFPSSDFAGGPPVDDEAALEEESKKKKKKAGFESAADATSSLTHLNKTRPKGPKGRRPKAAKKAKQKEGKEGKEPVVAADADADADAPEAKGFAKTRVQLHAEGVNIARVGSVKRTNPLFKIEGASSLAEETEADSGTGAAGTTVTGVLGLGGFTTTKFVDGAADASSTTDSGNSGDGASGKGKGPGKGAHGYKRADNGSTKVDEAKVNKMLADRVQSKISRDFDGADRIRDDLKAMGVTVYDKEKTWMCKSAEDAGAENPKKKRKMFGWLKGKSSKTDVNEGKGGDQQQQPRKKRKKVRSKQKNLKKDTRAAHLKPTYRTPGSTDYKQPKPSWTTKGGSKMSVAQAEA